MMTILHTETLKRWGGQQKRVLEEARGLRDRGHKVIIACHKGSILAYKSKAAELKIYEINMTKQAHLRTVPKLIKIIKDEKVELVATHSSVDSWAGGLAAKLTGRALVRFRHNLYEPGRDPLTRLIYSLPHSIVAISDEVKNVLLKGRLKEKGIKVLHDSVDTDVFNPDIYDIRGELGLEKDAIIIGNTSTFTYVKGQEFLLKAFHLINEKVPCYLMLAGRIDESSVKSYLSNAREDVRHRVILPGHRDDIPSVLKTFDLFVYPSLLEGLGTSLLEAMMMGRPVALSDIPTFRNFINDGDNGVFFRVSDYKDLAEKVILLLRNRELKEKIGRSARETALKKFTLKKMIDDTEAHYIDILRARR